MRISRRGAVRALLASGIGLGAGSLTYGAGYARHQLVLVQREVPVVDLPESIDGLRVGLITDIHHSATVSAAAVDRAVALLLSAAPDLVVLGGDYVSFGDRRFLAPVADLLAPLAAAPLGAVAVLGNHDDERETPAALVRHGMTVLRDQRTSLAVRGETLDLAGLRFWTTDRRDLARVLRGAGGTTLLLAHDPRRVREAAALGVPLVLSGHTHGGQVLLPGVGAIAGRKFPVLSGLAVYGRTAVFVSRGVGTIYLPVRLNCPPDVAVLTLRRQSPRHPLS